MSSTEDAMTEDSFVLIAFSEDEAATCIQSYAQRFLKARRENKSAALDEPSAATAAVTLSRRSRVLASVVAMVVVSAAASVLFTTDSAHESITMPLYLAAPPVKALHLLLPAPAQSTGALARVAPLIVSNGDEGLLPPMQWATLFAVLWLALSLLSPRHPSPLHKPAPEPTAAPQKPPRAAKEIAVQTGVRLNAAGRPIDAKGRFLSFAVAKELGWIDTRAKTVAEAKAKNGHKKPSDAGAVPPHLLTWNEFQTATAGHKLSRKEVSIMWAAYKQAVARAGRHGTAAS